MDPRTRTSVAGLNHNVRYRERVFHLQTENGGHLQLDIFTQVFLGGNVVASMRRASRANEVSGTDLRQEMEAQHRAVAKALLSGQHDAAIARLLEGGFYSPGVLANGARAPELLIGGTPPSTPVLKARTPLASTPLATPVAQTPVTTPSRAVTPISQGAVPTPIAQAPVTSKRPPASDAGLSDDVIVRHLALDSDDSV